MSLHFADFSLSFLLSGGSLSLPENRLSISLVSVIHVAIYAFVILAGLPSSFRCDGKCLHCNDCMYHEMGWFCWVFNFLGYVGLQVEVIMGSFEDIHSEVHDYTDKVLERGEVLTVF